MGTIIGHDDILRVLTRTIRATRLAHAYLFVGPSRVGKTTVATWVAHELLCGVHGVGCATSTQIARGVHPDVIRVASTGTLTVECIREWTAAIARSALLGGWKVGILEDVERCTEEAANAMLKTLEEPPARTVLCLTATRLHAVLPTIASRAAVLRFHRVPAAVIVEAMRARGVAPAEAAELAGAAGGCPGRAFTWLADPDARADATATTARAREMLTGSAVERLRRVEAIVAELPTDRADARAAVAAFLDACAAIGRQALAGAVSRTPYASAPTTVEDPPFVGGGAQLIAWLRSFDRARAALAGNASPRLVLEAIALNAPSY